jgi:hypothetical protein
VKLLGEQINTKVAVLAGGSRGRDADDLAGTTLEHQDVTVADVVAGDGDGVGDARLSRRRTGGDLADYLNIAVVMVVVGVGQDLVRNLVQALAERVVVTVLVVVTHLGFLGSALSVARVLYSLLGDLHVLLERRDRPGGFNGSTRELDLFGVGGAGSSSADSGTSNKGLFLEVSARCRWVDSGAGYANRFLVFRLDARAVLTFDVIDSRVVRLVLSVNVDGSLRVGCLWSGTVLLAILVMLVLLDTGTAVTFFFAREADLFFAEAVLFTRR